MVTAGSPLVDVMWGEASDHALEVRVFRCRQRRHWPAHVHAEHELVWCTAGVVDVEIGHRHWRLTGGSVLHVPGRVPHAVAGAAGAEFSCTFLRPPIALDWCAPTRVVATPLLRVHVACSLLTSGSSVAAASAAVGFSTPSAFAESFRRVVGSSPREYRRRPPHP